MLACLNRTLRLMQTAAVNADAEAAAAVNGGGGSGPTAPLAAWRWRLDCTLLTDDHGVVLTALMNCLAWQETYYFSQVKITVKPNADGLA